MEATPTIPSDSGQMVDLVALVNELIDLNKQHGPCELILPREGYNPFPKFNSESKTVMEDSNICVILKAASTKVLRAESQARHGTIPTITIKRTIERTFDDQGEEKNPKKQKRS